MTIRNVTWALALALSLVFNPVIGTAGTDDPSPAESQDTAAFGVRISPVQDVIFLAPQSERQAGLLKQIDHTRMRGYFRARKRELEDMPSYLMARPVTEPNTELLGDLFVPSQYLAIWFKLKLDKKGKQHRVITFHDLAGIKEFEEYAKAVVETLTFQPPDPRAKKQDWHYYRYGYGEPLIKPYVPDTAWENLLARYAPVYRMWNGRERDMINNPWNPGITDYKSPISRTSCTLDPATDSAFASFTGSTFYEMLVDTNGTIVGMRILESSGLPEYDQAVLEAARCNEFTPAIAAGRKVNATVIERRSHTCSVPKTISGSPTKP